MQRPRLAPAAAAIETPEPRFALGWACLVYALCTLSLGYPALAGHFLVSPISDQYIGGFPVRQFGATVLEHTGGFAQWNPYIFGGLPYVAAMHGDIFYPTFLLRMVMPTDQAMTWAFIIHHFLAGVFTYCFLRAVGLGFFSSLLGGAAYMMSGNVASLVAPGHDGKLYISALFPLTLWMLKVAIREGRAWSWGVLSVLVGLAVLSPHPQLLQYMLLACGSWALYLALAEWDGVRLDRRVAYRRLGLGLVTVLIGGAMGAIQYAPVLEYVKWSPRAGGFRAWEVATSYSMPPEELINTYLPQFSGILESYWGRNGIHFHSEYIGAAVLLLAGAGVMGGVGRWRRTFAIFWLGTLVVTLLWSLGGYTPFYHLVYALVPGTKFFRAPSTIFYIVTFSVAVLAALGTERALARDIGAGYLFGWLAAGAAFVLLAVSGGLTSVGTGIAREEWVDRVAQNQGAVIFGALRSLLFLGGAVGLVFMHRRRALPIAAVGAALVAISTIDLWSVLRLYWRFSPSAAALYGSDPTIDYLKRQPEPGRVMAMELQRTGVYHDVMLNGDGLMVHGVRNVMGYHGNELGRYRALYESDGALANPNFWRLYNVRYFLTNVDQAPFAGSQKLVGPVKNAPGSTVYLYSVPGENPAAWVVPLIVKAPDAAVQATVLDPRFDAGTVALFDTAAAVTGQSVPARLPAPLALKARVTRYEPGQISLTLDAPAPAGAALLVSENYYPGWQATVDGKAASTGRADFTLLGVELPAGGRQVELRFDNQRYHTGKTITLIALAVSVLIAAAGIVADRRPRQTDA